jgi:hypothetical protein
MKELLVMTLIRVWLLYHCYLLHYSWSRIFMFIIVNKPRVNSVIITLLVFLLNEYNMHGKQLFLCNWCLPLVLQLTYLISVKQKGGNHFYGLIIPDKTNGEKPALSKKNVMVAETSTMIVLREMEINHKNFFIFFWIMVEFAPGDPQWRFLAFLK